MLGIGFVTSISACPLRQGPDPRAAAACAGSRYVAIQNRWSQPVDVLASAEGLAPAVIGTVDAHSAGEFALNDGATIGFRSANRTLSSGGAVDTRLIEVRYLCR